MALKIVEFEPNWAFLDSNSSLNSPMAMKCCTKLETAKERCPIVFEGHPSNFKVIRDKTSPILTQIGLFPDYRPVAGFKSLRFALFRVILQISRSHRQKIDHFNPIWVRLLGWWQLSNPSDLPCSRSSIKFQGHTGWKIYVLNPIWVRLQGRLQLSNPSDLPCLWSIGRSSGWEKLHSDYLNDVNLIPYILASLYFGKNEKLSKSAQ